MNKAAVEYIQLVYFYRLFLIRYIYLSNLTSLLVENEEEGQPLIEENENTQKPPLEPFDCFEKGRIGLTVTGKELDEETGLYYFGARYYDPQVSSWISTDPALAEYLPTGLQLFFPEEAFNANSLKGAGGVFNSINTNVYHYVHHNPLKNVDPDGRLPAPVVAGFVGGVIGFGFELVSQMATGKVDVTKLITATAAGVISGATGAGVMQVLKPLALSIRTLAVISGASGGAASSSARQVMDNVADHKPAMEGVKDAAGKGGFIGAVTGGVMPGVNSAKQYSTANSVKPAAGELKEINAETAKNVGIFTTLSESFSNFVDKLTK